MSSLADCTHTVRRRCESISVRSNLVRRTVDIGQIYSAHATVYRTAGPVRTALMYSSVVVLPHTTSMRAWISARLGRQPSRTLSATAVITMRRCSAVSPSKRSGQRCSHVEPSGLRIATILLFQDAFDGGHQQLSDVARERTADCHLAEQLLPIARQRGALGLQWTAGTMDTAVGCAALIAALSALQSHQKSQLRGNQAAPHAPASETAPRRTRTPSRLTV